MRTVRGHVHKVTVTYAEVSIEIVKCDFTAKKFFVGAKFEHGLVSLVPGDRIEIQLDIQNKVHDIIHVHYRSLKQ